MSLPANPPLSPWRDCGDLVFTSGQIGLEDDGTVPGSFEREVERALAALAAVLANAGASLTSVLKTTVYLTDASDFAAMNAIYELAFPGQRPARTTVVSELAIAGLRFEIEAIAARSSSSS